MRTAGTLRFVQAALVFATLSFAWLRFSDNTVDNDLWGHVLYGQRYWNQGQVRETEQLSWTAAGFPVVNHEYLAEIAVGAVHRIGGGPGIFWYMLAMGSLTDALAFWAGRTGGAGDAQIDRAAVPKPVTWAALLLFAASINFIAVGFAVRPQLFTTLFLVI